MLKDVPVHPLLGLQLFTLGEWFAYMNVALVSVLLFGCMILFRGYYECLW
jgi:hypothetical protein